MTGSAHIRDDQQDPGPAIEDPARSGIVIGGSGDGEQISASTYVDAVAIGDASLRTPYSGDADTVAGSPCPQTTAAR